MATWQTDVLGQGLAHHQPTHAERRLARLIAKRWAKWQPLLLLELRKRPQPPGYVAREMARFESVHAARILRLLDHYRYEDYPGRRISQHRNDDPRRSDADFAATLAKGESNRRKRRATLANRDRRAHAQS